MATLDDLKDVFSSVNESIILMNTSLNVQLGLLNISNDKILDNMDKQKEILEDILGIEKKREKDRKRPDTSFVPPTEVPVENKDEVKKSATVAAGEEWGSLLSSFNGIMAAAAALGLAFAGLRGWEVKIIDYVKGGIGSITDSITNGLKSIKTNIFFAFGLDEAGKVMPNSALDDLLKTPIMEKITSGVSKLLAPLKMMGDFLGGFFTGSGGDAVTGKTVKFLGEIGDNIAAFAGVVGKILKPIGFLFSAYDGVMAFMNTEGDLYDKFTAGIGGFIGDFVGAPLDLLKSIVSWATSKLGFKNVTEFLESFSFETVINDIINGVFGMVKSAALWVGTLFTDPAQALSDLWSAMYGKGGLVAMLFAPVSMAIDWITKKFGWREEDAPPFDLYGIITGFVGSVTKWAGEKLDSISATLSEGFDKFANYIVTIPDRIKFAAEGMFIDVGEKLTKGFITFGDWLASIPARIKAMALSVLNSLSIKNPITGTVYKLVSDEDVAAAEAEVNTRSSDTAQKIADLESMTSKMREDLSNRMSASGIYESATTATAETLGVNGTNEREQALLAEQIAYGQRKLEDSLRANEIIQQNAAEREAARSGAGTVNAPVFAPTDARTTTVVGAPTIINGGSRNYRELNFTPGLAQ